MKLIYVAFGSADAMVSAAVGGVDLVSIAGVINGLTQAIVAGKKYKTFRDLRGATVGVQSLALRARQQRSSAFSKRTGSYPADYKLLAVGGGNFNLAALASGQVAAAFLVVPLVYAAEEQGMNVLGYYKDYIPNLSAHGDVGEARLGGKKSRAARASIKARCVPIIGCSRTKKQQRNFSPRKSRLLPNKPDFADSHA